MVPVVFLRHASNSIRPMSAFPVLMTADYWMNSQLSVARYSGGIKINGDTYLIVGDNLIRKDWIPVHSELGTQCVLGLIRNGTSLEVAKQMADEVRAFRKKQKIEEDVKGRLF